MIFPSVIFNSTVNVIIYNYFKIYGQTKKFLSISTIMLLISFGMSFIGVALKSLMFISASTVLSMLLWFVITDLYVSKVHRKINHNVYRFIIVSLLVYYISMIPKSWWLGMLIYVTGISTGYYLALHKQLKFFLASLIKRRNE